MAGTDDAAAVDSTAVDTGTVAVAPGERSRAADRTGVRVVMALLMILVAAADQLTKSVVLAHASPSDPGRGWFSVQLVRNHGASTGIGADHPLIVTVVEILAILLVGICALRVGNRVGAVALAVVLGGALGNVADRFARSPGWGRGAVVDWIHLAGRGGSLDLADVAIQVGAIVALIATVAANRVESRRRR